MGKTKKKRTSLPQIKPHFAQVLQNGKLSDHVAKGKRILARLLPEDFRELSRQQAEKWLSTNLPVTQWDEIENAPDSTTLYFLCSPTQEVRAEKVLLDVLRRWLIPEKEIHILGFHNLYFTIEGFNTRLFFLAEIQIFIEDGRDLSTVKENLPLLSNELSLSLSSSRYLEDLLDTKALSLDQKSSQIQQYLRKLTERSSRSFDIEIFREMSTFLALSHPDFRKFRLPKHLTRLVVSHYLMRKNILHNLSVSPEKRHLEFRFIRSKLHFPFGSKSVLGLSIAVALKGRYETFDEQHVLAAVQKFIPGSLTVKGSHYAYRAHHDPIKYLYLELEKKEGEPFSQEEVTLLRQELKEELKKRVEQLIPSVFMIRNEEEVMRNILLLSQELKYLSDLPQVMVNFERQEGEELVFTVIAVRILKKHDLPLQKAFSRSKQAFRFLPDRVQNVGYVRKKNPKEANVFHLYIPKDRSILRANSSVNFYLARQKVVSIINEALGDIRDYNGGMILKQGELLSQLKHAFAEKAPKNIEMLENFFFSLSPIEAQATTSLSSLKTLFHLFLETLDVNLNKRESYAKKIKRRNNYIFAALRAKNGSFKKFLDAELNQLENFSKNLTRTQISYQGTTLYGLIYETTSPQMQKTFQQCMDRAFKLWVDSIVNQQILRLSFASLPTSLDPRLGGDDYSSNILKMLFEGLTRISRGSVTSLAIARSVDISPDQRTYTFKLRTTKWSDGTPLTACDFEYAWKKILSPSFYTPFAYFFYPIKNAKKVKMGKAQLDQVGITVQDDQTLIVELENPNPGFLELTANALYSPVNRKQDRLHPNWAQSGGEDYICNGPMVFKRVRPNGGYEFAKNPNYWDRGLVKLDQIIISKNNSETAVEMYNNDEIDWIGHPMRPWEPYFTLAKDKSQTTKPLGIHWCVFNTMRFPFDHLKMRQAFFYAVDRKKLFENIESSPQPAGTPLPLLNTLLENTESVEGDKRLAAQLFQEALKELGLTRKTFPIVTLCFTDTARIRRSVAESLIRQWEETLGITCRLEMYPFHILFPKLLKGDYQMSTITWKDWVSDPLYTLSAFEFRTNRVNFPKWEHPQFQDFLNKAQQEINPTKRRIFFQDAEKLLLQECPIIPINYEVYRYMHKDQLKNAFCSNAGNIDFTWASFDPS